VKGRYHMQWLNDYRMRLIFVGIVAAVVSGGGNTKADFVFGEPTNLGPIVNSTDGDTGPAISADGLTLYFGSGRPGGYGESDLLVTTRQTINDEWSIPVNLGSTVNSSSSDGFPSVSADGLALYFTSDRPGGYGTTNDLWVTTRKTKDDPWVGPVNLGPTVNSSTNDARPCISPDGMELDFYSDRPGGSGGSDLWVTTRAAEDEPWEAPVNLGPIVNSPNTDLNPYISGDGLWLFFGSFNRSDGFGQSDLYVTTRASKDADWGPPVNLGATINSPAREGDLSISADGRTLYIHSNRPGGSGNHDLWQAPIVPIVDLNGDGIVDAADMCIVVDHWGENHPLCDVGPMPWGDGIVDVQDLIVLSEHLFEDMNDPTLVAHWPLDEAQGIIAYDNAAERDGTLIGGPVWQPDGGAVAGALQFDGTDDYVATDPVLNPPDPEISSGFSVIAWVMGGAPGQSVLSQADGVSWLRADSLEGCLMTELMNSGRSSVGPMLSQAIITDGQWHRIGFVWDGSYRHLYVDGAEVAKDAATLSDLESADGGLYFGVGSTLTPGTFFSGLIDDVRIYNRAVAP